MRERTKGRFGKRGADGKVLLGKFLVVDLRTTAECGRTSDSGFRNNDLLRVDDGARRVPMPEGVKANTIKNAWITCIETASVVGKNLARGRVIYVCNMQKCHPL
jgi:hypothetical protein